MPEETSPIREFSGRFCRLSNFAPTGLLIVPWRGGTCPHVQPTTAEVPSVEHGYQASKALMLRDFMTIARAPTAGVARRRGRVVPLIPNWEEVRQEVMLELLRQKFRQWAFRMLLLETGSRELIEGNTWGDFYWGVCGGVGENHLGKLLMRVREEIRLTGAPER